MSDPITVRVTLGHYDYAHPAAQQTQVYVQIPEVARTSYLLDHRQHAVLREQPWPEVLEAAHREYEARGVVSDRTSAAARAAVQAWLAVDENHDAMNVAWFEDRARRDPVSRSLLANVERLKARVEELLVERHSTNESLSKAAEALREKRDRIAELEAQRSAIPPVFVADYDGAPLTLHLTREAARDACDDVAKVDAHGRCWDWRTEEGGIDRQFWAHQDDDRPVGYTGGAVWQVEVEQGAEVLPLTVFRASHDSIVMGLYRTREAAREHCETLMRRENPIATLEWRRDGEWREDDNGEPGPDEAEELYAYGSHESSTWDPTGYVVTPLEVASKYDEGADE